MNKQDANRRAHMFQALGREGVTARDIKALCRLSTILHRWHELECGTERGCVIRDEDTGRTYWYNATARYVDPNDPRAYAPFPDRETGALKRLATIMAGYPHLMVHVQGDPRGAAIYVWTPQNAATYGGSKEAIANNYSQGIPVY